MTAGVPEEIKGYIERGRRIGCFISPNDFEERDGEYHLDGLPAEQWLSDMELE